MATEEIHDVAAILAGSERNFLVRSNGEEVLLSNLRGSTVGLYFSASWCGPCQSFTPYLIEAYNELASEGNKMEVVFISADEDEEGFKDYFAKMPWLAIPFADEKARDHLSELFSVEGIPRLVVLDAKSGTVISPNAVQFISEYGSAAYPFTPEKISKLKEEEEASKQNQTLKSLFVTPRSDYLISSRSNKVPVSSMEGKFVGLFFTVPGYGTCDEFANLLVSIYEKVKENGEEFEVVMVCLDNDEESYNKELTAKPWLAVPLNDRRSEKLARYFELHEIPTLIVLDKHGKTLSSNISGIIEEHGVEALEGFPFSPEKLELLAEKANAKKEKQTLESLLVKENLDYVVGKGGVKVPVLDLIGKNIGLYFSGHWCGPCRSFTPKLIEEYNKIRAKDSAFEIIFVSSDRDQESYDEYFSSMPWLALPFKDERGGSLKKLFKIRGIPSLVTIGPDGRTVSTDTRNLIMIHGANAYPFTEERVKELEEEINKMVKGCPEKVKHELHEEHELVLTRIPDAYGCDGCNEVGHHWSYRCFECNFDLHPKCALEDSKQEDNDDEHAVESPGEGYVCDGDVCRKV